jgi:hypothetical protein
VRWITRPFIGVDRMASAWLILRYLDPLATFEFREWTGSEGDPGGQWFDVPGARWSHRNGHATFHTLVEEYGLSDPVLRRMALVVDEADIVQEAPLEPAAVGVDIICRGIRLIAHDDHDAVARALLVFDALYAYFRDEAGGIRETAGDTDQEGPR